MALTSSVDVDVLNWEYDIDALASDVIFDHQMGLPGPLYDATVDKDDVEDILRFLGVTASSGVFIVHDGFGRSSPHPNASSSFALGCYATAHSPRNPVGVNDILHQQRLGSQTFVWRNCASSEIYIYFDSTNLPASFEWTTKNKCKAPSQCSCAKCSNPSAVQVAILTQLEFSVLW